MFLGRLRPDAGAPRILRGFPPVARETTGPGGINTMDSELQDILSRAATPSAAPPFWADGDAPLLIYGTGSVGQDVLRILTTRGLPVTGFMDHREPGRGCLHQVRVCRPDDPAFPADVRARAAVILAIHNPDADLPAIIRNLTNLGYRRFVSMIELSRHFAAELGPRFWLTNPGFYANLEPILAAGYSLWADDKNRSLYTCLLKYRTTGDLVFLPEPDAGPCYCPADVPAWENPVRVVDCGAYTGDSLTALKAAGYRLEAVASFEPDAASYSHLVQVAREVLGPIDELTLWPCGVFSSAIQMRFDMDQGTSSRISSSGSTIIQCISLDEAIPHFAPTLIKMDIEGAEHEALLGAREMIARFHPGLAISVYHRPEDLWQIPLLVERVRQGASEGRETSPAYEYYLRMHRRNGFEVILYAVPSQGRPR